MRHQLLRLPLLLVLVLPLLAQDKKKDDLGDLLDDAAKGTKFRLVALGKEDEKLDTLLYWRTVHGNVAARTAPSRVRLGNSDVIVPILNPKAETSGRDAYWYPTEGRVKLSAGKHILRPGNIPLEVKGVEPSSAHPAIQISKGEVLIRCAPVRLDVVDERGAPVPAPLKLGDEGGSVLREESRFSVLIAYLPVGCEYQSSLGNFSISADGKVKGVRLSPDVRVTEEGLRKSVPVQPAGASPGASEVIRLVGPGKDNKAGAACRLFVPATCAPGASLWLAVSRREYRTETGQDFAADHFSFKSEDAALVLTAARGQPAAHLLNRATRALNTTGDDLGWIVPRLPAGIFGPTPLALSSRFLGSHQFSLLAADIGAIQVVPHRWRTVFARTETVPYTVVLPRGTNAGEAKVLLQLENRKEPIQLGNLKLPAVVEGFDSRLFTLNVADLPPGKHQLWIERESGSSGKVPVHVVSLDRRSPFFTQSMSGCTTCWPTTEEGLKVLEDANIEMVAATGAYSNITTQLPRVNDALAARLRSLGLPAELAVEPTNNDRLLERLLRHRLKFIDMTVVRAPGLYFEGLSYHHSYQPDVERMVRRMQLFAQQTADYPSLWGFNYSWFPKMYGYAEGGVPTDAHVGDRNRVLIENVKAAGFKDLTREEREWIEKNKLACNETMRQRMLGLMKQGVDWRNATEEAGWGKHNEIYNGAVREVKPDMAFTLFENAGHDEGKRLASMFKDMNAQCYESYTDFGDWPMSSGFVTDWSHGQTPGQPVWLTTCWGTSEEGKMKSLFHAFARGLEGGGVPMQGNFPLATLERRGKGLRFASQYGAIARNAKPDGRVAILARDAHAVFGRLIWDAHAVYYHLTRLGYPPVILNGDSAAKGIAESVKVLVLVKEEWPLEPELRKAIEAHIKRGGKVLTVGPCADSLTGAIEVKDAPKHLWELKGFHPESHEAMWSEFEKWRKPLAAAMAKTELPALATTDPQLGYALAMEAGPIRYVAVIADSKGTHSNVFEPVSDMPVSLEGTGWTVRDLVKQKDLKTEEKEGRTLVKLDLLTEPTTLLALYRSTPTTFTVEESSQGGERSVRVGVADAGKQDLGSLPLRVLIVGPDGVARPERFAAAGETVALPLAPLDQPGPWVLTVQEMLTGATVTAEIIHKAPEKPVASVRTPSEGIHVAGDLAAFKRADRGDILVIVEPEQGHLLSLAKQLAEKMKARVWQVKPEEFDTHPIRWYPTPADRERLKEIAAGRLIGVRESLRPYIDTVKRVHVPERGGYSDIDPPYMVGKPCVVFAGGRLAESLRAVTPWMQTPHAPGKGQGRLVVCHSPFMAGLQAVAIVANDLEGLTKAAEVLAKAGEEVKEEKSKLTWTKLEVQSRRPGVLASPYAGFTPIQRVDRLLATADGKTMLFLKGKQDNAAFVDAAGKVTSSVHVDLLLTTHARLDAKGDLQMPFRKVTATHPGWGFPTEVELTLRSIGSDGRLNQEMLAFRGELGTTDFEGGIRWSEDGSTAFLGRSGGFLWRTKDDKNWRRYDDTPYAPVRFSVLYPRQPTGVTFSPDGRYALFTMDSRPPFGGLNSSYPHPWSVETVLFDLQKGARVWAFQAPEGKATYAIHSGFAALSRDATVAAFADYGGTVYLVDKSGKVLLSEKVIDLASDAGGRSGPPEGVSVSLSLDGKLALFAYRNQLAIARGGELVRVPLPGVTSACLSRDASQFIAACLDGTVSSFSDTGKRNWQYTAKGAAPLVAAGKDAETLIATGAGELIVLDAGGKETRRTNIVAFTDRDRHEVKPADDLVRVVPPVEYVEPNTLGLAKEKLSAKEIARWKPKDEGIPKSGRSFHSFDGKTELSMAEAGDYFVHIVYRRPANNKGLKVLTDGKDGPETFLLDLPTPEYRVIDISVRGPKVKVTLVSEGPAEVAEFSLWSMKWPGPNLAYVRPAGVEEKPTGKGGDDILDDLEGKKGPSGKLKDCRVWWPNTDFDSVRGPWLPAPIDPLAIVDGKRFGGGRLGPWSNVYLNFPPSKGGFFTIDLGEEVAPSLLATYDRSGKQSEVCLHLAVFRHDAKELVTGGALLGGQVYNDQFWRLVPIKGKVKVLGIHAIKDEKTGSGLSEIELYR